MKTSKIIYLARTVKIIFFISFLSFSLTSCSSTQGFFKKSRSKYHINTRSVGELHDLFRYNNHNRVSFLSSHRGGADKDLPENCISTFEHTLKHTYSIIEVDPRYTKDKVAILHHDNTLDRTTSGTGLVSNYTLKELKELSLRDLDGKLTKDKIPTLEEALKWAKGKTILVLDKKDIPIEERVKLVEEYNAETNVIIMAYTFEEAKKCYSMNSNLMMQVFINTPEKIAEFDKTGIPWKNVVVFVTHDIPNNPELFEMIHEKGSLCIVGTSRTLDRKFLDKKVADITELKTQYDILLEIGVDIIETDIPTHLSKLKLNNL